MGGLTLGGEYGEVRVGVGSGRAGGDLPSVD